MALTFFFSFLNHQ